MSYHYKRKINGKYITAAQGERDKCVESMKREDPRHLLLGHPKRQGESS